MSTHNICFHEDLIKIIFELSSNMHLISSAVLSKCQLTSSLSCLGCSLVDIEHPGNVQLHGMEITADQSPQLKLTRVVRLDQLQEKFQALSISSCFCFRKDFRQQNCVCLTCCFKSTVTC